MARGFPGIVTRAGFGPIFENRARIRSAKKEFDADLLNFMLWQLAGMNGLTPRAMFVCDVSGGVLSERRRWLSWDADGVLPESTLVLVRTGAGVYTWTFSASSFADFDGASVQLAFEYANPIPQGATALKMVGEVNVDGSSGTVRAFNSSEAAADPARFVVWLG